MARNAYCTGASKKGNSKRIGGYVTCHVGSRQLNVSIVCILYRTSAERTNLLPDPVHPQASYFPQTIRKHIYHLMFKFAGKQANNEGYAGVAK